MQELTDRTLRLLAVGILVAFASGCGARTVVDENGKPMAGVHAVAEWWADGPGYYSNPSHCVRLEAMVTGADGKFDFPYFSGNFNPVYPTRQRNIKFFKAGYELVPKQIEGSDPVKLRPFSGDPKQRFEDDYYIYSYQCKGYEEKLYPVLKEIHSEARLIARTQEQQLQVIGNYEYLINEHEIGKDAAHEISNTRKLRLSGK